MTNAAKLLLDPFAVIPDGEKVAASFTGRRNREPAT
jgi:hypothetical protein